MLRKFRLKKLIALSLIFEIILFPWINAFEAIEVIFYTLFFLNITIGIFSFKKVNFILNKFDSVFFIFILISLLNPNNFLFEFTANAPYLRLFAFFLRYLTLDVKLLRENINFFTFSILVSSSMVLFLNPIDIGSSTFRLYFPYGDPNYVSFIFGSYAFILFSFFFGGFKKSFSSIIQIITILLCVIIVILTASRGGFLSLFLTIFILFISKIKTSKLIFLIAILFLVIPFLNFNYLDKINIFNRIINPIESDDGALDSRFQENYTAFNSFISYPHLYVFGRGLGSSNIISKEYSHQFRIHNTFISVFNDSGIIGLVFFSSLMFRLFNNNRKESSIFLFLFLIINSQTIYLLTIYQFHICLKFLTEKKKST